MIQSVYVEGEFRGKGIFRSLYSTIVSKAEQDPRAKGVRLYVEKGNIPAQSVYESLGMTKFDEWDFNEKYLTRPRSGRSKM